MSWSVGFDPIWQRDIGYGVPAICDHAGCEEPIDRGMYYICGGEPYGGTYGCGLFFCEEHLQFMDVDEGAVQVCGRCVNSEPPFEPTPDVAEWIHHKETDPSWAEWRADQP